MENRLNIHRQKYLKTKNQTYEKKERKRDK